LKVQIGLVVAAVFAAFFPALSAGFLYWDDDRNFLLHEAWRGLSPKHLEWMATTFHNGHYQPLSWLTLAVDHALWGMDARGYHFTNVLLHSIGSVAFYFLARTLLPLCAPRLEGTKLGWAATCAALLFAVHPLRVESVAWVTERRDVLSGIFFTLSILYYLRWAGGGGRLALAAALACMLLSLLSKAWGIVLPAVFLLLDLWPLRRPLRAALLEKIPFVLLALPFAYLAWAAQESQAQAMRSLGEHGFVERLAQAAYASIFYPAKTFVPVRLTPIYELPAVLDPLAPRFLGAAAAALLVSAGLFLRRRQVPALWTAWACFLVVVAPVSGIAQSGPQLVAERYTYLACMPFALLAAGWLFARLPGAALVATIAVTAILAALTCRQTAFWKDTETLFQHALAVDPRSYTAHDIVAGMLLARGRTDEAEAHCRAAIALAPEEPIPRTNLGLILVGRGRLDEAVEEFRGVLRARPDFPRGRVNLAVALFRAGRLAEAEIELKEAARRTSEDPAVLVTLGGVLLAQDRPAEAIPQFEAALRIQPGSPDAREGLARAKAKLRRTE